MPKIILKHSETLDDGTLWLEDQEAELDANGNLMLTSILEERAAEGLCYLYKPQVIDLVKFLIEHGNMFNEIYSFYIDLKIREAKEKTNHAQNNSK